jgi:hypothetical protein
MKQCLYLNFRLIACITDVVLKVKKLRGQDILRRTRYQENAK